MKISHLILAMFFCVLPAGCESGKPPEANEKNTGTQLNPEGAREVNRYEFVESELVRHPEDEAELNHNYMGSLDGYDYIFVRSRRYKIPSEQLKLKHSFPVTEDNKKWIPLRIHFSHVKDALD